MFASVRALLAPRTTAYAHCDLPCGVYDPAQARIEAESVKAIQERYQNAENMKGAQTVEEYRTRALAIKERFHDQCSIAAGYAAQPWRL